MLRRGKVGLLLLGVGMLLVLLVVFLMRPSSGLVVDGKPIKLELVSTEAERQKGLSGRKHLPRDKGMLFVFDAPGKHCFWMKDMQFDLDMVWLDADQKIVDIARRVSHDSYPLTFCPDQPALYGIELNAGVAKAANLKVGQQLNVR